MHDGKASTVQYRANGLAIHVLTKGRTDLGPPEFSESGPEQDSAQVKTWEEPKREGLDKFWSWVFKEKPADRAYLV